MINLLVDEAYAFDFLSILFIKRNKDSNSYKNWKECENYIKKQLPEKFEEIMDSKEFNNLLNSNIKTFDAVELAKKDLVLASYVDNCNYERYLCKKDLQYKFFENNLNEIKVNN